MNQATTYDNSGGTFSRLAMIHPLAMVFKTINTWIERQKYRSQFALIDGRYLKDVGISEADRFIEVNKSFSEQ